MFSLKLHEIVSRQRPKRNAKWSLVRRPYLCLCFTGCELYHCSANKALIKYTKRLQAKQQQLKSWQFEHPEDRDAFIQQVPTQNVKKKLESHVSSVEQKDASSIEHVESTTTFLTNLEVWIISSNYDYLYKLSICGMRNGQIFKSEMPRMIGMFVCLSIFICCLSMNNLFLCLQTM